MKNICIGLFEGEVLPESLAAFKDVKLDLEFGKITTIYTLNQMDCEKVVVVGLGDGKKNIKEAYSKVDADDYLALYMVLIAIKKQRCMSLNVIALKRNLKKV